MGGIISSLASSAIDISDGIIQDLSHLISSSGVGCDLDLVESAFGFKAIC